MIEVGKMIARIRKERGYSQQQLADKLNLSKQAISNYETGKREPDYLTLEAIADVLNGPVSMLISPEDQERALSEIFATYPQAGQKLNDLGQQLTAPSRSKEFIAISEGLEELEKRHIDLFQALYKFLTTTYPDTFKERIDDDDPES